MSKSSSDIMRFGLASAFIAFLLILSGCSAYKSFKNFAGYSTPGQDDEETAPPEAQQETVMLDGKPYIRSKNPYWLAYPDQPEYNH